jgi:hypothetical protein
MYATDLAEKVRQTAAIILVRPGRESIESDLPEDGHQVLMYVDCVAGEGQGPQARLPRLVKPVIQVLSYRRNTICAHMRLTHLDLNRQQLGGYFAPRSSIQNAPVLAATKRSTPQAV